MTADGWEIFLTLKCISPVDLDNFTFSVKHKYAVRIIHLPGLPTVKVGSVGRTVWRDNLASCFYNLRSHNFSYLKCLGFVLQLINFFLGFFPSQFGIAAALNKRNILKIFPASPVSRGLQPARRRRTGPSGCPSPLSWTAFSSWWPPWWFWFLVTAKDNILKDRREEGDEESWQWGGQWDGNLPSDK